MNLSLNKRLFFLLLALAVSPSAQAEENLPPLPDKAMPALMPALAAWEVTYTYVDEPKAKTPAETALPVDIKTDTVRPQVITVTRTGDIVREQITWSNSRKTEKWIYRKLLQVLEVEPGGELVRLPASYLVSDYTDYSESDFPGFHWVGQDTYTAFQAINGQSCFIFTAKAGTVPAHSARDREMDKLGIPKDLRVAEGTQRDLIAAIDSKSLLPISLDDGVCRKDYRILPAPSESLKMPPAFEKEFGDWVGKIKEAARVPTPP